MKKQKFGYWDLEIVWLFDIWHLEFD